MKKNYDFYQKETFQVYENIIINILKKMRDFKYFNEKEITISDPVSFYKNGTITIYDSNFELIKKDLYTPSCTSLSSLKNSRILIEELLLLLKNHLYSVLIDQKRSTQEKVGQYYCFNFYANINNAKALQTVTNNPKITKLLKEVFENQRKMDLITKKFDYDFYQKETLKFFDSLTSTSIEQEIHIKATYLKITEKIEGEEYYYFSNDLCKIKIPNNTPNEYIVIGEELKRLLEENNNLEKNIKKQFDGYEFYISPTKKTSLKLLKKNKNITLESRLKNEKY